jgi:hypothetical protein
MLHPLQRSQLSELGRALEQNSPPPDGHTPKRPHVVISRLNWPGCAEEREISSGQIAPGLIAASPSNTASNCSEATWLP